MRASLYAAFLTTWALSSACLSAPTPDQWLAVGFRSPEQTFGTFQTGLRAVADRDRAQAPGADPTGLEQLFGNGSSLDAVRCR